jgi:ech hydrogenase subunit C
MSIMKKSPWIVHYNASSCNGCDLELVATLTPMYDPERFGIINTGNPKHADLLLVTGSVNARNESVLLTLFDQMPSPKAVVAIGICATSGCVFAEAYNVLGGVDKVLPVDVYVPGCAARPEAILDGILKALDLLEQKRLEFKRSREMGAGALGANLIPPFKKRLG